MFGGAEVWRRVGLASPIIHVAPESSLQGASGPSLEQFTRKWSTARPRKASITERRRGEAAAPKASEPMGFSESI